MANRPKRVASLIKVEIGSILVRDYSGQTAGFTTVTDVRVTPDLRLARVYISVYGDPDTRTKTMTFLESEKSHIRGMVGSRIRLRFTPELEFLEDTTLETVDRINYLIRKIHRDEDRSPDES